MCVWRRWWRRRRILTNIEKKKCNKSYINIEIERKEIVSISFRKIGSDIWTGRKITNDIIIAADDDDDDDLS